MFNKVMEDTSAAQDKLHAILAFISEGVLVINAEQRILECNQAAHHLLGYDEEELLGKNLTELMSSPLLKSDPQNQSTSGGLLQTQSVDLTNKEGISFMAELTLTRIGTGNNKSTLCFVRDLSEKKSTEEYAEARREIFRVLMEFFTLADAAPKILEVLCKALRLKEGALWEVDEKQQIMRCVTVWCDAPEKFSEFIDISKKTLFEKGVGLPGRAWESKSPVWIADVGKDTNCPREKFAQNVGLCSAFAFPILFNQKVVAIAEFFIGIPSENNQELSYFLSEISDKIGIFVEREHNQIHMATARERGIADVGVTLLHNIGNVLNSVGVSVGIVKKNIAHSDHEKLFMIIDAIKTNLPNLAKYLTEDPKGKVIPQYLGALADTLKTSQNTLSHEIDALEEQFKQIKDIVAMRGVLAGKSELQEKIFLPEIIDSIIRMVIPAIQEKILSFKRTIVTRHLSA